MDSSLYNFIKHFIMNNNLIMELEAKLNMLDLLSDIPTVVRVSIVSFLCIDIMRNGSVCVSSLTVSFYSFHILD